MLKKIMLFLPLCLLLAAAVFAAGGTEDPLASLSYLSGSFSERLDREIEQRLDDSDRALLEKTGGSGTADQGQIAPNWTQTRLKAGDLLLGSTGTNVLVLAGQMQVTCSEGTVVDVTTGTSVSSGALLLPGHRYLAAEDTTAAFSVTGKTAVVNYQGPYGFQYSGGVDYNAMASALKALHLFQGSLTGYGQGFDLEKVPTRLQAMIMFIRVLGEEQEALNWTGTTPFTDIAKGSTAEKYVGYAYSKGYTNGYSATQFKPAGVVNAHQYTEFILRAMGYSTSANTNLSDTLTRAKECGVLTEGECAAFQQGPFLRADLVYISYYALEAMLSDGSGTLADTLMKKGVFTEAELEGGRGLVSSWRL